MIVRTTPRTIEAARNAIPKFKNEEDYISTMANAPIWGEDDPERMKETVLHSLWFVYNATFKEIREMFGLERTQLERLVGIPHSTIVKWEQPEESSNYRPCPGYVKELLWLWLTELYGNIENNTD